MMTPISPLRVQARRLLILVSDPLHDCDPV
jgi:hypothetical protein